MSDWNINHSAVWGAVRNSNSKAPMAGNLDINANGKNTDAMCCHCNAAACRCSKNMAERVIFRFGFDPVSTRARARACVCVRVCVWACACVCACARCSAWYSSKKEWRSLEFC